MRIMETKQLSYKKLKETALVSPRGAAWYVIQTKPQQENQVHAQIKALGLEVYQPLLIKDCYVFGKIRKQYQSLFPQYLFVRFSFSTEYNKIRWLVGVKHVIASLGKPIEVNPEIIQYLKMQGNDDGVTTIRHSFERNQEVVISNGPLKDLRATFLQKLSGSERVLVLLKTVSMTSRVQIHSACLKAV